MRRALLLTLALSACMADPFVTQSSREVARGVVDSVMAQRLPGVNVAPYTDCIINEASTEELVTLASYALSAGGAAPQAIGVVGQIAQRPGATRCLVTAGLGGLALGGLL